MSAGGTLEELWKSGRQGNLCPLEQVRAIALCDAYTDLPGALPKSGGQAALLSAIAERETKIGGGHPSKEAIRLLLERYDADPSGWYPGKSDQAKFGPSPVLNGAKRRCTRSTGWTFHRRDEYNELWAGARLQPSQSLVSAAEPIGCSREYHQV